MVAGEWTTRRVAWALVALGLFAHTPGSAWAERDPFEAADVLAREGRPLEAMGVIRDQFLVLDDKEEIALGHKLLGDLFFKSLKRSGLAIEQYRLSLKAAPKGRTAMGASFLIGMIHFEESAFEESVRELRAYLKEYPDGDQADAANDLIRAAEHALKTDRSAPPFMQPPVSSKGIKGMIPLITGADALEIRIEATVEVLLQDGRRLLIEASPIKVGVENRSLVLNGRSLLVDRLKISPGEGEPITLDGIEVDGAVQIIADREVLDAFQRFDEDRVLRERLSREVGADWPVEAAKAQAVLFRTFLRYRMACGAELPRIPPSITEEAAVDAVSTLVDKALKGTGHEVLLYKGEPIHAVYHRNSGGRVASAGEAWGVDIAYLPAKDDPHSAEGEGPVWRRDFTSDEIVENLGPLAGKLGGLVDVQVNGRSVSGRALGIKLTGASGEVELRAGYFASLMGEGEIASTVFTITRSDGRFAFAGRGAGHGVGMSQDGARAMAAGGLGYAEILGFYYPGTAIGKVD